MKGNDIMKSIESLKSNFNKYNSDSTKDQIKQFLVLPLIQHLGWEIFNPNEVDPCYPAQIGYPSRYETIDYVLKNGNKKVFIMIKKKMKSYEERLPDYYQENELDLLLLTNGTIWMFYLPINEDIFQGKFYEIDMSQESFEFGMSIFELFLSKENIENGEARKALSLYRLSKISAKEWAEFFESLPNIEHHNDFLSDMRRDGVPEEKVWHEFISVLLKDYYPLQNIKDKLQPFDIEEEEIEMLKTNPPVSL